MKTTRKKLSAVLISFLSIVMLFSCSKKDEVLPETPPELPKPVETFQKATVLTDKLHLCLFGRDGAMHKIIRLGKTDTVEILHTDGISEPKEIDGTMFFPAVHDSCDYWIDGTSLAFNSVPAVIIEKEIPCEDKNLQVPVESLSLKFGRIIALSLNEEHISENSQLAYFIDSQNGTLKSAWIRKNSASSREDDLAVMQVVEALKVTKRATPRNELFKKAAKYRPCAKVAAALDSQKVELVENNYQDVLNALPGAKIKVNVHELLTVDQSKDPFK